MMEIVLGLFLLAIGIWGLFDEYYYVLDFFKGGLPVTLMAVGLLATLAGCIPYKEKENVDDK